MLGKYIVTSSTDSIKIWQRENWSCVRMLEYESEVTAMDVAGEFLFCGDANGMVTVRSLTSGTTAPSVVVDKTKKASILALVCLKEARLMVCCSVSGEIQVFETG